jgi:hypothetical protein
MRVVSRTRKMILLANSKRGDKIRGNVEKGPAIEETQSSCACGLRRRSLKGSRIDEPPKKKPSRDSPRDRPGSKSSISERRVSTCRCAMNWEASMMMSFLRVYTQEGQPAIPRLLSRSRQRDAVCRKYSRSTGGFRCSGTDRLEIRSLASPR